MSGGSLVGRITITMDGEELNSEPGASLEFGGVVNEEKTTDQGTFSFQKLMANKVECEVVSDENTDLSKLVGRKDLTITFTPDVGKAYVLSKASFIGAAKMTGGDGGKVPMTFTANKADPVGG